MTALSTRYSVEETASCIVRSAVPEDNEALIALAAACPMRGPLTLRIDRAPDFFALNRLEGDRWSVGVAERNGVIVGCIGNSERRVWLDGSPHLTGYTGDLKVHPEHRDGIVADELTRFGVRANAELPRGTPTLITVLAGNRAMERRLAGPRGLPRFDRIATVRTHSITIMWKRRLPRGLSLRVQRATWKDLDEMIALWNRVAPQRHFAPVLDADSLSDWIRKAPGLDISSYRLARDSHGELLGFVALWDQSAFKELRVDAYSARMAAARHCFNAVATAIGGEKLPAPGMALRHLTALHICVPGDRPDVLRAIAIESHNSLRHAGYSFINFGLDVEDPLTAAFDGLFAQPTDINACVSPPFAPFNGNVRSALPFHYEIALV
ncbi:MAG TPA: hypothetical protein VM939_13140 [Gemmatimonadaceae bacterium]|nr:hypothetical protein [Gemmatimonadaceae bacterium]